MAFFAGETLCSPNAKQLFAQLKSKPKVQYFKFMIFPVKA